MIWSLISHLLQAFEPKYKELATKLKKTQPNLIIAKMDATANDAPSAYAVEGFPTIYFAPSGKKVGSEQTIVDFNVLRVSKESFSGFLAQDHLLQGTPIKYEGNRDLDHLTKFMESNAVKSFQKKEEL